MRKFLILLSVCSLILICSMAYADEIRVEGGGAAISAVFMPMQQMFEITTGDKLDLTMSSPVKGLIALVQGRADIAAAAVPLSDLINGAEKEGVKIDPKILESRVIAKNRTVVFLHSYNEVKKLSRDQLKDIFTGKITNWGKVGGDDGNIVVVWGKNTPGQNALFTRQILDGEPVSAKAVQATDYYNIREIVSTTPGAIGIDPHGLTSAMVNVPQIPLIESDIILITKGKASPRINKVIEYYMDEFSFLND